MARAVVHSKVDPVYATLIVVAVLWGSATGLLLPRAAYRLSVEPEDAYRDTCGAGHPIIGPARGWLGTAGCATCAAAGIVVPAEGAAVRTEAGEAATTSDAGTPVTPVDGGAARTADIGSDAGTPTRPPHPGPSCAARATSPPSPSSSSPPSSAARSPPPPPRPELAVWLLLAPFAVLLALVDRNVHRLPDQLTLPLAAASAVLLGIAAPLPHDGGSWPTALLGGLVLGACYFVLFLINPNGMGFGDVKLALSLGVVLGWYGWLVLFVGAFAGFLLGSLYGLGLMALRRANRKSAIPFGPFMIAGALLGVLLGALAV